jgi:hypothetical protein
MSTKIVVNACYGGFGLSDEAMQLYRTYKGITGDLWVHDIARHDPALVRVVEELGGKRASGSCARLVIEEIAGKLYRITEYDGYEGVETPGLVDWIVAE